MSYLNCDGIEFLKSLPDKSVDGIFTDPPWGSGPAIKGQDKWQELINEMARECPRILKPRARVLIWIGARQMGKAIINIEPFLDYKWMMVCRYIPPKYVACFFCDFDPILYFSLPGEKMYWRDGKYIPQQFTKCSTGKRDTRHPCARPIQVVKKILREFFEPGEYIIDPFAGSDTTGVACRELDLNYNTCEIDPEMYRYGIDRNRQQFLFEKTGKAAEIPH